MSTNWILTYTGLHMDLLDPQPDMISIVDIAHALSMINRFGGHTRSPYSVAQHSVLTSNFVAKEYKLQALLHDASEAYLGDIVQPMKTVPAIAEVFGPIEDRIQAAIYEKFCGDRDLGEACQYFIRKADRILLATERRDLMPPDTTPWPILEGITPLTSRVQPVPPQSAESLFLTRYKQLTGVQ